MTTNATYREKGRAVFLAALMVLSVVAMSASFAGAAAATNTDLYDDLEDDYEDGPTYDPASGLDGEDVWVGQVVTIAGSGDSGTDVEDASGIEIHEGLEPSGGSDSDNRLTTISTDNDGAEIDTADLDDGEPYHLVWDGQLQGIEFWVENEELDVSFDDDYILEDETATLEFESERGVQIVNVTETNEGLDAEDIEEILYDDGNLNGAYLEYANTNDFDGVDDELHDDDDVATFVIDVTSDEDGEIELVADMEDFDAGDYEFAFDITDSLASDNASLEVRDDDADRTIESTLVQEGDLGNITITLDDTDDAAVQVGDFEDNNYEVGFFVEDDNGYDEINITMNTYMAGGGHLDETGNFDVFEHVWDAQQEDVDLTVGYINMTDGDTLYVSEDYAEKLGYDEPDDMEDDLRDHITVENYDDEGGIPADAFSSPLATDDYELTIGDTWEVDSGLLTIADDDDSSYLTITERTAPGDVVTHTAPNDDSMSDLEDFEDATITDTDTIANEDYLLFTIEDFGSTGVLDGFGDNDPVGEQFAEQGIFLELEQQDTTNQPDRVWNNSVLTDDVDDDGEYALDIVLVNGDDYEGDQLILKIDYEEFSDLDSEYNDVSSSDVRALAEDEDYDWTFSITEDNPYVDDDEEIEVDSEFTLDERSISLDGSNGELPASSSASVTGTTNVAPGTEVDVRASATGTFVESDDAIVDSDFTFEGVFDLSDQEVGLEVELEATEALGEDDDMDAVLVEADDDDDDDEQDGINLDVDYDDTIEDGDTAEFDATVDNNDEDTVSVDVTLEIDGESHEQALEIDGGDSGTASFAVENLSVDEYEFEITADSDDDSDSYEGTLTVSDGEEAPDDDDADPDDAADDDDDDDDDDGTPGFGVAVALVALLSAALLALRRQD